jgi:NTE family protein
MAKKIGVALSGGGARGLAHIGVLKVMEELDLPIAMLAGTSMGGIVAAFRAAGTSAGEIEELASSLRLLDILQWDSSGLGLVGREKTAQLLRQTLGGDPSFDQLEIPLALTAVDLESGQEVTLKEGSVVDAILATTALAAVFPPTEWQGRMLVDGGFLNPVPFDVVHEMGADRVVASHTYHDMSNLLNPADKQDDAAASSAVRLILRRSRVALALRILERSMSIQSEALVAQRMRHAPPDLMIQIPLAVGLFDLDRADETIDAGEAAARRHMDELIELRDYVRLKPWTRWWRSASRALRRK